MVQDCFAMSSAKRQRHNEHRHEGHEQASDEGTSQRQRGSRQTRPQQPLKPTHYSRIAAIAIAGIVLISFFYNVIHDSVGAGLVMLGFFAIYGLFVAVGVKWWRQQRDLRGG